MSRRQFAACVLLITGVGAALRLVALGSIPPGLYQDEAFNGLDALRVLAGEHPVYFTTNNGREPIYIYLASLTVAGLGRTPAAVRLPAALLGTLTIPSTALLGSCLFRRRVGLLAAVLIAITFWPLHLSRVAFRAVGLPLFVGLALAATWHGARKRQWGWVLVGGIGYGLAFYTYLAVRFSPIVLLLFAVYLWATGYREQLRRVAPWFALGTGVVLLPLVLTALTTPGLVLGRLGQVSILSRADPWNTLLRNLGRGLGMFFLRGDTIPRHNSPGRPVFDPLIAGFFVVGLIRAGRNWRHPAAALMLLWSLLMLAPTVLAEDAPHFLRAVGVLPLVMYVPALGIDGVWQWLGRRATARRLAFVLVAAVLGTSLGLTLWDYFGRYARDAGTGYAFQSAAVEMADEIDRFDGPVWASERFVSEWEAIPFLVESPRVDWLSATEAARIPDMPALLLLWPYDPIEPFLEALPTGISLSGWQGPLIKGDLEPAVYPLYWGYHLERIPSRSEPPLARFAGGISLEEARVQPGATQVILYWTIAQRLKENYTVFVHIVDPDGIVAQNDSPPASGTLPTGWWMPGNRVVDAHAIAMPVSYDPARHRVMVGLYLGNARERLAVLDADGQTAGDMVALPTVEDAP